MDISNFKQKDSLLYQEYKENYVNKFNKIIEFGTAGFRSQAKYLDYICYRSGIFMGIVSKQNPQNALGFMITASHNPIQDNGFKYIDYNGEVFREKYEKLLDQFMLEMDLEVAVNNLLNKCPEVQDTTQKGLVMIGRDTRPSSLHLQLLYCEALELANTQIKLLDQVTTPQLHYCVNLYNTRPTKNDLLDLYYQHFSETYNNLVGQQAKQRIQVDCANGIGALSLKKLIEKIPTLDIQMINHSENQFLNDKCGAEFIQKEKSFPRQNQDFGQNRSAAFDGDADRIVYFFSPDQLQLNILDGDKILALYLYFVKHIIQKIVPLFEKLKQQELIVFSNENLDFQTWSLGAVQTAYANGASSIFLRDQLQVRTVLAPTGVKNIHHEALQFDVGAYFESNGHGTILVNDKKLQALKSLCESLLLLNGQNEDVKQLYKYSYKLYQFLMLSNQVSQDFQNKQVGDAMSNLLMIESILHNQEMSCSEWNNFFKDLPSRTTKLVVKNKNSIKNNYDQSRVLEPADVQQQIDDIVKGKFKARAFIRPSGTEDVVRLYVEAENSDDIQEITEKISEVVRNNKIIN